MFDVAPTIQQHPRSKYKTAKASRPFVIWDGEGITDPTKTAQDYVLFGCYNGTRHEYIERSSLSTLECLDFIIDQGRKNPDAIHVGFAFDYDVNMILGDLKPRQMAALSHRRVIHHLNYRIEHLPGKWFRISHETDTTQRFTVTIQDVFGFFQTSLIKSLQQYIPDHPLMKRLPELSAGKDARHTFAVAEMDAIRDYWKLENELALALVYKLKSYMYDEHVGFYLTKWHGPGAIASYLFKHNGVKDAKADTGEEIYDVARYAYAGGRFELFRAGRHVNAYGIDINSAYPHAISQLPNLARGTWRYVENPTEIVWFGVYEISSPHYPLVKTPAPLFHRDAKGNISFSWLTRGWYWSPEAELVRNQPGITILRGWEFIPDNLNERPFAFVPDLYAQRQWLKAREIGAQVAIKLGLNSLYGKMAQRAGWERQGVAPSWHQLEWAGWVTSYTRAKLFSLIRLIPWDELIAVETDGIYTTQDPATFGIIKSPALGDWDVLQHDEMIYLQSGIYAMRDGDNWSMKYRGLDKGSLTPPDFIDIAHKMIGSDWPTIAGPTTRFVGYRQALQRSAPYEISHNRWETTNREIAIGQMGKRRHSAKVCRACSLGLSGYEMPHDLITVTRAIHDPQSTRHKIPWLDQLDEHQLRSDLEDYIE